MEAYNSRGNMCKFHDFVLGHGHGKMAKIRETPKIKNFLLSINSKWPPRSKSWRLKGVWINVLEALVDQKFIEIDALLMCMCNFNIFCVCLYYSNLFRPLKFLGVWNIIRRSLIIWNTHCVCVCTDKLRERILSYF